MKRATAYKRGQQIIILHASSRTNVGVWILSAPVLVAEQNDPVQLGNAILTVLDGSKENIAHPTSWTGRFDVVLKLAGVKTWSVFAKSAKCVQIEFETNRISFLPTRNLGAKDGFEPLPAKVLSSPPESRRLGTELLRAFDNAE
jgi:hypothetical protein